MEFTLQTWLKYSAGAAALLACCGAQAAQRVEVNTASGSGPLRAGLAAKADLGESELKAGRSLDYPNGLRVQRHEQYYQGVPVLDGFVVEHRQGDAKTATLRGSVLQRIAQDLPSARPVFSAADILLQAKTQLQRFQTTHDAATLYVHAGRDNVARLVYLVSFYVQDGQQLRYPHLLIDANLGRVLQQWDGHMTAAASGPGGNTRTGQYEYGTQRPALDVSANCSMDSNGIVTVNLDGALTNNPLKTPYQFACPRNTFKAVNGGYAPLNDIHAHAGATLRMYMAYLNTPPVPLPLVGRGHPGNYLDNASWGAGVATFGDGVSQFYPLVALDVVAHEFSHGYTERNSGLNYFGMPGGMNEAFSDMAGEAAEYHARGSNDFLVGAEIVKSGAALRQMSNPSADGQSIEHTVYHNDFTNVHHLSGIYNKAFYRLATRAGWNARKAFEVMADANRLYWTKFSSYNEGACGVENAARNRGYVVADVTAAFNAVGVNCGAYRSVAQQLYLAQLGRPADVGGLNNFIGRLQASAVPDYLYNIEQAYRSGNQQIRDLVDGLGNSAEARALYPGDNTSFVHAIFNTLANRAPTSTELANWLDQLNNKGASRGLVALAVLDVLSADNASADGKAVARKTATALYFTAAIDTSAELAAYSGTRAAAKARAMLSQVGSNTDVVAFQNTADQTLADLVAGR
ncbi:M4 family metallopeptidase [Pseudoduganella violacea]|uniref:Neutral metalloproteinase n=1 Tax=Pseudoduganella violacea TaxID=1715466 RepID=A0A7W5BC47_9BURK|nr:M4 family metallopeptidase [Pseudoduganella violacea]MBB3120161.1 Zn-dependent metalloprotease [Pseudoduganella violacea]